MLEGTFILTEKTKKDNRIEKLVHLIETIDCRWKQLQDRLEAISQELKAGLATEEGQNES